MAKLIAYIGCGIKINLPETLYNFVDSNCESLFFDGRASELGKSESVNGKQIYFKRRGEIMKVSVIYWSGTGNTEAMANLIKEGAESTGAEVSIKTVDKANVGDVTDSDIVFLGCPSMGDEALEDSEFEPFITKIEGSVNGKKLGLFGSYGWGNGQWMDDWSERMKKAGAKLLGDCLIVNEAPSGNDIEKCKDFGKLSN